MARAGVPGLAEAGAAARAPSRLVERRPRPRGPDDEPLEVRPPVAEDREEVAAEVLGHLVVAGELPGEDRLVEKIEGLVVARAALGVLHKVGEGDAEAAGVGRGGAPAGPERLEAPLLARPVFVCCGAEL